MVDALPVDEAADRPGRLAAGAAGAVTSVAAQGGRGLGRGGEDECGEAREGEDGGREAGGTGSAMGTAIGAVRDELHSNCRKSAGGADAATNGRCDVGWAPVG